MQLHQGVREPTVPGVGPPPPLTATEFVPTSADDILYPCRRHFSDQTVIPLYTYSESNITTSLSPAALANMASSTPLSPPTNTLSLVG